MHALAMAYDALGDLQQSVAVLEPLLADARAHRRWLEVAEVATSLVATYHEAGDLGHSIELGEHVLAEVESAGLAGTDEHLRLAATVLWSSYERGDLLYATHRAAELVALAEEKGTTRGRGSIYWNASLVAEGRGDLAEACRLTERALAYLSEGAVSRDLPRLHLHYGWLLLRSEPAEPHAAIRHLESAREGLTAVGTEIELARCDFEIGRAHLMLGDVDRAEDLARAGLDRLSARTVLESCHGNILLGDAMAVRGDMERARDAYRWAADMLGMMTAGRHSAAVWRSLGDRMLEHGDLPGAVSAYDSALREAGIRPSTLPQVGERAGAGAGGLGTRSAGTPGEA